MATQAAVEIPHFNEKPRAAVHFTRKKPIPEPGEGQVLVRVILRPINPSDIFSLTGLYAGFRPNRFPATPGLEGMGVVEKTGPGATKLKKGQRVVVSAAPKDSGEGSWQQYLVVNENQQVPIADDVSDEDAAQFLVNPVTAYCFVDMVPKGKWLLHNAANSILGKELIAMAKAQGVKTINLVRRKEAADELLKLGADSVLDVSDSKLDLSAEIREITGGEGVWAAFNPIAGEVNAQIMKGLRNNGVCYIYSVVGGSNVKVPMADVLFRGIECKGFWLMPYLEGLEPERREQIMSGVMSMLRRRVFKPEPPSEIASVTCSALKMLSLTGQEAEMAVYQASGDWPCLAQGAFREAVRSYELVLLD